MSALASTAAPFAFPLRIYWEDTDAGGIVFYANYLKFFERARTEWLRSLGFGQEQLRVEQKMMFVVSDTTLRYLKPARLDDRLSVTVAVQETTRATMTIAQQAWLVRTQTGSQAAGLDVASDKPELLAEGTIRIACVDAGTYRPRRIPNFLLDEMTRWLPEAASPAQAKNP
ncbi:tol-pal system-associated acyl-CoA thioesterase [soil metagenome]